MLALKPHPAFRPKSKRLPKAFTMTIAAGFPCSDGLVLCADTQETIIGYAKVETQKMTQLRTTVNNFVFTGSGDSGLIEMTIQLMDEALTLKQPTALLSVEEVLRESLVETFNQHLAPWSQFAEADRPQFPDLLIGIQQSAATFLYRANGTTLRRVYEAQCVGTGIVLAKALMAKFFNYALSITQGWLIALYILYQAKTWVDGCGGNSDILLLSNRDRKITRIPTTEVSEMEEHFAAFDAYLRPVLLTVADRNTSQSDSNQIMKQFTINMLGLRGKFMEFEEFAKRLFDLHGLSIPGVNAPALSEPDSSQSQKS